MLVTACQSVCVRTSELSACMRARRDVCMWAHVPLCACTCALRAVLRPECGHSALNGFHSQNGLLEASGRREAKPSAPVQPEEDVDRRPQLCWKGAGAQRGARNGLSGSSKLAAISIRLGQLCLESVWLSLARLAW